MTLAKRVGQRKPYKEIDLMAGVAAGAVAAAEVNSQPAQTGGASLKLPASWSTIWFIVACLYLVGVYWGYIKIGKVG